MFKCPTDDAVVNENNIPNIMCVCVCCEDNHILAQYNSLDRDMSFSLFPLLYFSVDRTREYVPSAERLIKQ